MSQHERNWLKRQQIDDKALKEILEGLVAVADNGVCQITQMRLAKKVGMSDRNIRRCLTVLEALGIIDRSKQTEWGKKGRSTDLIFLSVDRDFNLSKETISAAKSGNGLTGQMSSVTQEALTGQMSAAPTSSSLYRYNTSKSVGDSSVCTGRVFYEKGRELWRAKLKFEGLDLDLGRHETEDLAWAEINVAIHDIEFALAHPVGTPVNPKINSSLKSISGKALCDFLVGFNKPTAIQSEPRSGSMGFGGSSPDQEFEDEILISRSDKKAGAA